MATVFPMIKSSFDRLRDEIDNTFDRWLAPRSEREGKEGAGPAPAAPAGELPRIDMDEDENEIRVMAELPGMAQEDFKVELLGNRLLIKGEKKTSREEKKRNYYFSECSYGSFSRTLTLPSEVDAAQAEATYKNGILKLRLPKTEQSKAKRIDVSIT